MSLELVAGLFGSQLARAVAGEVVTTLACQVLQHAITSAVTAPRESAPRAQAPREPTRPAAVVAEDAPRLRTVPTVEILSATTGRARLRVQGLRGDEARAIELSARLRALDGVTAVEAKALTGTLLVRFDARRVTRPQIQAALEPRRAAARPRRAATGRPLLRVVGS